MCLTHTDAPPYKCWCCCGCPIICGVVLIAVYEVFNLMAAIQFFDIGGIVVSSILLIGFLISFVKRESHFVRRSLFYTYGISLILFLINLGLYLFTNSLDNLCETTCNFMDYVTDWNDCPEDMGDLIWVFISVYTLIILLVRVFFIRILYYYAKEAELSNPAYQ